MSEGGTLDGGCIMTLCYDGGIDVEGTILVRVPGPGPFSLCCLQNRGTQTSYTSKVMW